MINILIIFLKNIDQILKNKKSLDIIIFNIKKTF